MFNFEGRGGKIVLNEIPGHSPQSRLTYTFCPAPLLFTSLEGVPSTGERSSFTSIVFLYWAPAVLDTPTGSAYSPPNYRLRSRCCWSHSSRQTWFHSVRRLCRPPAHLGTTHSTFGDNKLKNRFTHNL